MPGARYPPGMREEAVRRLLHQARNCEDLGSPLYGVLLRAAADEVRRDGPHAGLLAQSAGTGVAGALRLLAAVHRLVLTRRAPGLALHYPDVGGTAGLDGAPEAFLRTLSQHRRELEVSARRPLQTNEVGRAAPLLTGFLAAAAWSGLPLRVLEVGASAGLLLRWDRYRYESPRDGWSWGPAGSPVVLSGMWDAPPPTAAAVTIAHRRGCDPAPVDPSGPEGRLALTSSVWPDQPRRMERLRAALSVAAAAPVTVDVTTVARWLPPRLRGGADGVATVVYQSVVEQYLPAAERAARDAALEEVGNRATRTAPLAWLRFEPARPDDPYGHVPLEVHLRTWPGGADRRIATAAPHGDAVTVDEVGMAAIAADPVG